MFSFISDTAADYRIRLHSEEGVTSKPEEEQLDQISPEDEQA